MEAKEKVVMSESLNSDELHFSEDLVRACMKQVRDKNRTMDGLKLCGCDSCIEAHRRLTKEGFRSVSPSVMEEGD
jgi:hypothetical protein